jgi:hypothetical protein
MKQIQIKELKKGNKFWFNNTLYTVKQKHSDWKKDGEPYLLTTCGQIFYFGELEIEQLIKKEVTK